MAEDNNRERLQEILRLEAEINNRYADRESAAARLASLLADQKAETDALNKQFNRFANDFATQTSRQVQYSAQAAEAERQGQRGLAKKLRLQADLADAAAEAVGEKIRELETEKKAEAIQQARLNLAKQQQEELKKSRNELAKSIQNALQLNKVAAAFTFTSALASIKEANSVTYDLSKQFGISLQQSRGIRENFEEFSQTTTRLDFGRLAQAQKALGEAIGQNVLYSNEMAGDFVEVTEYMGLSTQAAGRLAQIGATLGMSSEDYRSNIAESLIPLNKNLGINMNIVQAYEDIGKLSNTTVVNLGRNQTAMLKLVATARRFGIEMEQVSNFGSSLLDFESSIANELEAEVLSGKQLNLERARAAALRGDDVALAQELATQVGTLSEYERMNVVQRESLAKAFGMNIDQMSGMLLRQEAMNQLSGQAASATDQQLAAAKEYQKVEGGTLQNAVEQIQKREDVTKKLADSMMKVKTIIADLLSSLDPILDRVVNLIQSFAQSPLFKLVVGAGLTVAAIAPLIKAAAVLQGGALRGMIPAMPLYVRDQANVGANLMGGGSGMSMAQGRQIIGKYGSARNFRMAKMGMGGGAIAGIAGMGLDYLGTQAEAAGQEGLGYGLGIAGGLASGAGTGAMIGSLLAPITGGLSVPIGAGIGAIAGGLMAYLREEREDKEKEKEQAAQTKDEATEYLRKIAERSGNIYMDSNQVGLATVQSAYRMS